MIIFLSPQQSCITIVFSFSWEKLKTMVMQNFLRNKNIITVFSKVENNWEGLQVRGGLWKTVNDIRVVSAEETAKTATRKSSSLPPPLGITKLRRRRQGERQKSRMGLMGKTTTLHVHHWPFFVHFFAVPAQLTTWNDQILSLIENGNRKALNSTISVWARAWSPLFSSNQNSLLLRNRANWDNRENVLKTFKRMRSLFIRDVFMDVAVVGS